MEVIPSSREKRSSVGLKFWTGEEERGSQRIMEASEEEVRSLLPGRDSKKRKKKEEGEREGELGEGTREGREKERGELETNHQE